MDQLLMTVFTGCIAILIGVTPVAGLIDDIGDAIERFRAAAFGLPPRLTIRMVNQNRDKRFNGQIWFAVAGAALIVIAVSNYGLR